MVIEIKKGDTPEDIEKKLKKFSGKITENRNVRLRKYFGVIHLNEDAVTLQRKWRDEW